MGNKLKSYKYRIDGEDNISYVDQPWLDFAQQNEAPDLTEQSVLGRNIWEFVCGESVRHLYQEIIRGLRSESSELVLPFRCDSPSIVRHMALTMRSGPGGSIDFEGKLVREEERDPVSLFSRDAPRSDRKVEICSMCRRLRISDEWLAVGEALVRCRWFSGEPPPHLRETLCPGCQDKARTA